MTTFGLSGPGEQVMEHFGFTTANVVDKAQKVRPLSVSLLFITAHVRLLDS
jgi:hypothetical protein